MKGLEKLVIVLLSLFAIMLIATGVDTYITHKNNEEKIEMISEVKRKYMLFKFLEDFKYQGKIKVGDEIRDANWNLDRSRILNSESLDIVTVSIGELTNDRFILFNERVEALGNMAKNFNTDPFDYNGLVEKINKEKGEPDKVTKENYFKILENEPTLYYEFGMEEDYFSSELTNEYAKICDKYYNLSYEGSGDNAILVITVNEETMTEALLHNEEEFSIVYDFARRAGVLTVKQKE